MDLRLNANAIITNSKGEFLLIKLKSGPFAGKLCIPGGGINPGETIEEAIKREINEETGIVLKNKVNPFGFCELFSKEINQHRVVLLAHSLSDEMPKESDEGTSKWMSYQEAEKEMIAFAKEAIKIWNDENRRFSACRKCPIFEHEKKTHFVVDYDSLGKLS